MRPWGRRLSVPLYVIAVSIALSLLTLGWIVRENYVHAQELREQGDLTIQFLRNEVCSRLLLRDEIQISYLQAAANRYTKTDPAYADVLQAAVQALQFTKDGCAQELPDEIGGSSVP